MKYILSVLLVSNILTPFNSPVNQLNGGTQNEFSYNYVYFVDYYEQTQTATSGIYEYSWDYPKYYGIKVNIVFKNPIKSAKLRMEITAPQSGQTAYWDFIGENCYITKSSNTIWYIDCYNCTNATFIMIESYEDVHNNYGYNRTSFNSIIESNNTWIDYGTNYCNIRGLQVQSNYVVDTSADYSTQLNTLLSQTDGIENYLLQIWNSVLDGNQDITNISTSLGTVNNYLQAINNKLDNISNIKWTTINTTYKGWTTDYQTFDNSSYGYHNAGWYVIENPNFNSSVSSGIYKLTIPLGGGTTTLNNIKLAQYWENQWREFNVDMYLYYPTRNYAVLYFNVSDTYHQWPQSEWPLGIYVDKQLYKYSAYNFKLEYIMQTDEHYWDLYNIMLSKKNSENIQLKLDDIIDILDDINLSLNDITEYHEVDNYVDNLVENIQFPTIPEAPNGYLERLQIILDPVKDIFASNDLSYFRWIYTILAVFTIFKLVVR